MTVVESRCAAVDLPPLLPVRQHFDGQHIAPADIPAAVCGALEAAGAFAAGQRVAITCSSRGITNYALIIKAAADFLRARGAHPVLIPAMGSHGGATAEGQRALLERFGITEAYTGCPIHASMETVEIGTSDDGVGVRIDKAAAACDAILVVNRVKAHTDFRGAYESGLMKMMAVGLGKVEGAAICHAGGFEHMARRVEQFGRTVLRCAPVACGLAIIENASHQTCRLEALAARDIPTGEPALLEYAKSRMARIQLSGCDVLVVDRIGKEISGDGMDPNVCGVHVCRPIDGERAFRAQRIAALDLTKATGGQAVGMGMAHVITRRLFEKIDYDATYINALVSRVVDYTRIPPIMPTDKQAIQFAALAAANVDLGALRMVRIADTAHIETIWVSPALAAEAEKNSALEITGAPQPLPFDAHGNLL